MPTKTEQRAERMAVLALRLGIAVRDVAALMRAERTLHRWAEEECGNGNDFASWAIERDEATGKPYRVTYPHRGHSYRVRIPDREVGALARVAKICAAHGLHFWHQTDPRGCALYVSREPLSANDYTRGEAMGG